MLPDDFDEHGNLPAGVHRATLAEVMVRFNGPSMRRKRLTRELQDFASLIQPAAIGFLMLNPVRVDGRKG